MPRKRRGLFRKEGTKNWYAWVRDHVTGKRLQKPMGEDLDIARQKFDRVRAGVETIEGSQTVEALANEWVGSRKRRNAAGRALAAARVTKYLAVHFRDRTAGSLDLADCVRYREFLDDYEEELLDGTVVKLSPTTITHVLADFRCMLRWGVQVGKLVRNPMPSEAAELVFPKIEARPPDRLTDEELVAVCSIQDPHGFVCRLGAGTGMRWGEMCRAQASHVRAGALLIPIAKSAKPRHVPIPPALLEELRGRVGRLVPFSEASKGSFNRTVRKRSGVKRFHLHQLRHTFACLWVERGGRTRTLQAILGHQSIETTERYEMLGEGAVAQEAREVFSRAIGADFGAGGHS